MTLVCHPGAPYFRVDMEPNKDAAAGEPPEVEKVNKPKNKLKPQKPQVAEVPSDPSGPCDTPSQVEAVDATLKSDKLPTPQVVSN